MLVSEILTDVKNHGFADIADADLLVHLNDTYQDICNLEAWPFLEKTLTTTFTPASQQVSATTDIKQILSFINTVQGYELQPMEADSFYKQYSSVLTQTGFPVIYYQPQVNTASPMGYQLNVWPIPSVTTACQIRYLYIPATLTTSDTPVLPARFHRILTWGTLLSVYRMEDDPDSGMEFQNLYDRHYGRMRDDLWSKQYDRQDIIEDVTYDDMTYYY